MAIIVDNSRAISNSIKNPNGLFAKGRGTFDPHMVKIIDGTDITIVIEARNFITIFKLLDISAAKNSRRLDRTLAYI